MNGLNARRFWIWLCILLTVGPGLARAHVGVPDVYVEAVAGPYKLLVSVHPPAAVPGAAAVDVRSDDPAVRSITVSVADQLADGPSQALQRFSSDQLFTGSVWVANGDAWRVHIHVDGDKGQAETSVPVPAASVQPLNLWEFGSPYRWIALLAVLLGVVLVIFRRSRTIVIRGWIAIAVLFAAALAWAIHRPYTAPPQMRVVLDAGRLRLSLPGKMDDLVEDHGYLMHLFAVREPQMDVILHLHPHQVAPGQFEVTLPAMAAGAFHLYADVVHKDGRLETLTASAGLPAQAKNVLRGDDSEGVATALGRSQPFAGPGTKQVRLADGYTMTLDLPAALKPRNGQLLRFMLLDAGGQKPTDMQLYMGMPAHAAVVKADGSVFAHIHPTGTIPMAAYGSNMSGMDMSAEPSNQASFPFGFPAPGTYRVFVQMKHGEVVDTGAFDLLVQ